VTSIHFHIIGGALTLAALATGAPAQQPQASLNTLNDLGAALRACWVPPPLDQSRPGMQITVMMSFKRNGDLSASPGSLLNPPAPPTTNGWPTAWQWRRCSSVARLCRSPTHSGTQWPAGRSPCD
jgi:hypothetical protein